MHFSEIFLVHQKQILGESLSASCGNPEGCSPCRPGVFGEVHVRWAGVHQTGPAWAVSEDS